MGLTTQPGPTSAGLEVELGSGLTPEKVCLGVSLSLPPPPSWVPLEPYERFPASKGAILQASIKRH